ncbi:MAG: hypothetical protein QXL94_02740 [Candidatus Parvarchaeum sp.]
MKAIVCNFEFNSKISLVNVYGTDNRLDQLIGADFSWISKSKKTANLSAFIDYGHAYAFISNSSFKNYQLYELEDLINLPYIKGFAATYDSHATYLYWELENNKEIEASRIISKEKFKRLLSKAKEYVYCQNEFDYYSLDLFEYSLFKLAVKEYSKKALEDGKEKVRILKGETRNWSLSIKDNKEALIKVIKQYDWTRFAVTFYTGHYKEKPNVWHGLYINNHYYNLDRSNSTLVLCESSLVEKLISSECREHGININDYGAPVISDFEIVDD